MQTDPIRCLCECEASLVVHFKDFLDGVYVGRCAQIKPQVVLIGRAHNLLGIKKYNMEYYRLNCGKSFMPLSNKKNANTIFCEIFTRITVKKHLKLLQHGCQT